MTVAEAEERIEALTRNLASSEISPAKRVMWEAQNGSLLADYSKGTTTGTQVSSFLCRDSP